MKINIKIIMMLLIVVTLGLVSINQFFGWYYKIDLLANPCDSCRKFNSQYEKCFEEQSTYMIPGMNISFADITLPD